uniref:Uncharacterized protein n=1 Tax=Picea glauca TaxID=3330 RepID=A0A101LY43_PICGL|nr:hypothetical protein ABT39_MTgene5695 [Picea glauca]
MEGETRLMWVMGETLHQHTERYETYCSVIA